MLTDIDIDARNDSEDWADDKALLRHALFRNSGQHNMHIYIHIYMYVSSN